MSVSLPDAATAAHLAMTAACSIVFGSMRMSAERQSVAEWASLLVHLHQSGVRSLHSSDEYDSFPLFCEVLAQLRCDHPGVRFRHVVKLGEPSFSDRQFDVERFDARIATYAARLATPVVHDVQWMWRKDLQDELARLQQLADEVDQIGAAFAAAKRDGRIERAFCFPYTTGCAELMLDVEPCDGLIVYRNAAEREFDPWLDRAHAVGKVALIIRPFMAGSTLAADAPSPAAQFAAAIDHPAVEGGIVSLSSHIHFDEMIG